MRKKKILLISNLYWNFANFRKDLIDNLTHSKKFDVFMIAKEDGYSKKFKNHNLKLYKWYINENSLNILKELFALIHLSYLFLKIRPDFVFSFTSKPNIYSSILLLFLNFKFCPNITGLGSYFINKSFVNKIYNYFYKNFFKRAHCVFVQNYKDKKTFKDKYKLDPKKIILLPGSGINLNKFSPKYKFNSYCINFLLVARLIKDKGIQEFYEASSIAYKTNKKLKFFLIGDFNKNNKNSISIDLFQKIKKAKHIKFKSFKKNISSEINNMDCVVLPSYREGKSRFLLEGLALGKPLITSNVPGCEELCTNFNGYKCKPMSVQSLSGAIIKMSKLKKKQLIEMGKQSRSLIENKYDLKYLLNQYNNVINLM